MMGSNSESATGRLTMGNGEHILFFLYHVNSVLIQWITVNTGTKQVYWDCLQIIFQLFNGNYAIACENPYD